MSFGCCAMQCRHEEQIIFCLLLFVFTGVGQFQRSHIAAAQKMEPLPPKGSHIRFAGPTPFARKYGNPKGGIHSVLKSYLPQLKSGLTPVTPAQFLKPQDQLDLERVLELYQRMRFSGRLFSMICYLMINAVQRFYRSGVEISPSFARLSRKYESNDRIWKWSWKCPDSSIVGEEQLATWATTKSG